MYGLPKDINLDFFLNKQLINISIGYHSLILNFDDYLSITVSSAIKCIDPNGLSLKGEDFRNMASTLAFQLTHTVVSVEGKEDGTLKLAFDNGRIIEIYDDSEMYESYVIKNDEQIIVV